MANLGNLIVRGVTRILGDAYANKFIGNLQGNADTATSAIKASTADSATSATSANKASIATAVQDYGTSDYREIKIGYNGSGLSSSTITHAVGFTDGGTKIKDISKDEFRNWLATASGTWPITVSNSSNSENAQYANYLNVNYGNEFRFGNISSDQMNLWFNYANPDGSQNNVSNYLFGDGKQGTNSTIHAAQFTGNAATATKATQDGNGNVITSTYLPLSGGTMDSGASVKWPISQSSTWDTFGLQANTGLQILNTIGASSTNAPSNYSVGLSVSGYYGFCLAYYGGGDIWWLKGNGDEEWKTVIHSGNIGLQSVNYATNAGYATSAGNADTLDNQHLITQVSDWDTDSLSIFKSSENSSSNAPTTDFLYGLTLRFHRDDSTYHTDLVSKLYSDALFFRRKTESGYGSWRELIHSGNISSQSVNYATSAGNAASASNASAVNGISLTWDGEITSSQWIAAWESGTSIRTMSAYNTFISMCSYLDEGVSDVTDGTMFITSYATDNGFDDPNGKNKPYKRKASFLWNYINNKCSSIYATTTWVNSNYYTCSESDSRYIQSETDPIWTAAKGNYYTKTECDNKYIQSETDPVWTAAKGNYYTKTESDNRYQLKGTYLTEQNLQGYATQEWVRGEEYLYRSGGTMDARAEIGITTKLFIGNSTSSDTCYTKFNCILHGGGDESNPNWVIRDNGYAEFKSSVSANAFYASSDIRLKNILDDINIDFDKLKLIPKKYYTWKGSDILQLGTIAQDIQKIYPEVVSKNENGYLSVDYSKLSIIALAAIDKLNERIKELECQIKL